MRWERSGAHHGEGAERVAPARLFLAGCRAEGRKRDKRFSAEDGKRGTLAVYLEGFARWSGANGRKVFGA